MAAAVWLVLVMSSVETAGAQSEATVRVSNLEEPYESQLAFLLQSYGQSFTTGNSDVTLETVRMNFAAGSDYAATPEVTVREDISGQPGSTLVTLATPTLDRDISTHEDFTVAGQRLSANTTYWVVITRSVGSGPFAVSLTNSEAESTAEEGWSLGNQVLLFSGYGWWSPSDYNIQFAVHASAAAPGGL